MPVSSHLASQSNPGSIIQPQVASNWWVIAVCSFIMMAEGFDLLIYSNALPSILTDQVLQLNKAQAGNIGSMVFVGMLLGGVLAGRTTMKLGVTRAVLLGFGGFTIATALIAFISAGWQMGVLRFLAGFALGVVLPAGISLARQHSQARHSALAISIVMSGIPVGGMLAAVVALYVIPEWGWRPLFLAGGFLGFLLIALIGPFLARIERSDSAQNENVDSAKLRWHDVFRQGSRTLLVLGTLATLADLLTWYGVSIWLTQLMREFDVPFNGAMQLMFTLNIGAILGSLFTASVAMRWGTRPVAIAAGLLAAASLLVIASRTAQGAGLFALIALLGMSAISAQNLVNALVADSFPLGYRAAAMGITLGVGRLGAVIAPALGGYILNGGHDAAWVLVVFALSAFVGVLFLLPFTQRKSEAAFASLSQAAGNPAASA